MKIMKDRRKHSENMGKHWKTLENKRKHSEIHRETLENTGNKGKDKKIKENERKQKNNFYKKWKTKENNGKQRKITGKTKETQEHTRKTLKIKVKMKKKTRENDGKREKKAGGSRQFPAVPGFSGFSAVLPLFRLGLVRNDLVSVDSFCCEDSSPSAFCTSVISVENPRRFHPCVFLESFTLAVSCAATPLPVQQCPEPQDPPPGTCVPHDFFSSQLGNNLRKNSMG